MKPQLTCCEPCEDLGFCSTDVNCCIECHTAWEEAVAGPYLPPWARAQLRQEHRRLEQIGYRSDALAAHSQWEEEIFARYCPPDVCAQILVDHDEWEKGKLKSRTAALKARVLR